jgi:hypothetical protein
MRAKLILIACSASLLAFYLDGALRVFGHAFRPLTGGSWTDGH